MKIKFQYLIILLSIFNVILNLNNSSNASDLELIEWMKSFDTIPNDKWDQEPFDLKTKKLLPMYIGVDIKKFYNKYRVTSEVYNKIFKRNEFETIEEYKKRTSSSDTSKDPFGKNTLYAFKINDININYDPDKQIYLIGDDKYSKTVARPNVDGYMFKTQNKYVSIIIGNYCKFNDTYIGNNIFGSNKKVFRSREINVRISIPPENLVFKKVFKKDHLVYRDSNDSWEYYFYDKIHVDILKAKEFKKDLGVLFIGNVNNFDSIKYNDMFIRPTYDSPVDSSTHSYGIPIDIVKIIYYHIPSGEIIAERNGKIKIK